MPGGSFTKLFFEMTQRPLAEQIDNFAAGTVDPVNGQLSVNKTQNLYFIQEIILARPPCNFADSFKFSGGDPSRSYLKMIHIHIFKQKCCNMEFFERRV
jgi:hypothetical protein